jgi:hypothetical protein
MHQSATSQTSSTIQLKEDDLADVGSNVDSEREKHRHPEPPEDETAPSSAAQKLFTEIACARENRDDSQASSESKSLDAEDIAGMVASKAAKLAGRDVAEEVAAKKAADVLI